MKPIILTTTKAFDVVLYPTTEPPRRSGIYCWWNRRTKQVYVGKAIRINKRRESHLRALRIGKCNNPYFQNAWNKYGEDAFLFCVIEVCSPSRCCARELYWMRALRSAERRFGYNIRAKGIDVLGWKRTEESRRRMSEAGKLRVRTKPMSEESRRKISEANTGSKRSRASRKLMSERAKDRHKGRRLSDHIRKKISETLKRNGQSAEHRARIAEAVRSPKVRAKMSRAHKGVPLSPAHRAALAAALRSPEVRAKIARTLKGRPPPNKGVPASEEQKVKLKEAWVRRKQKFGTSGVRDISAANAKRTETWSRKI